MQRHFFRGTLYVLSVLTLFTSCQTNETDPPPNIIYILADDLGYAELGAYGQEKIETPNLDQLAREGMLFTQHYSSAPVCAPARYMLLTGKHSGHAFIRGNHEWGSRGDVWSYQAMVEDRTLEGQHPMPDSTVTLAHRLQQAGYTTGMVGKWGLGAPHTESIPTKMGFDFFYGYNCQRIAHTLTPVHLYHNEERVILANDTIAPGTKLPEGADPKDPASYEAYTQPDYAPELMFEALTGFVEEQAGNPFFLYWATPIPHVPIQAPERWVKYYQDKFGPEEPYLGQIGYFPHRTPHAGYAAMVSYLDENIGKLIEQLKKQGIYENTLIMFTSDNGPSYAGGADSEWFESAAPFSSSRGRCKGAVYEGGIRVPLIASWPGHIAAGSRSNLPSVHYDMLATLGELTGYAVPEETDGVSFLPTLLGQGEQEKRDFLYWEYPEYGGQVAIRQGDWKLVRQQLRNPERSTTELYNLAVDSLEQHNVANQHPEQLEAFRQLFESEHQKPTLERFVMPALEKGLYGQ
jgi:arylsulfatase